MVIQINPESAPAPSPWILFGPNFRLPIEVAWSDYSMHVARVRLHSGLPWLECWKVAARAVLDGGAVVKDSEAEEWLFTREILQKVGAPWTKDNLEDMIRWDPDRTMPEAQTDDPINPLAGWPIIGEKIRAWLQVMVSNLGLMGFKSFSELENFYLVMCRYMERWLQERPEPIEMIFCRLYASPMKANWPMLSPNRQGLKAKGYLESNWFTTSRRGELVGAEKEPLLDCTGNRKLARQVVKWRVVAMQESMWKKSSRANEVRKLDLLGSFGYIKSVHERIKTIWPWLVVTAEEWRKDRATPGLAPSLAMQGVVKVCPKTGKIKERRPLSTSGHSPGSRAALARVNQAAQQKKRGRPPGVASPDAGVPAVPDLPPGTQDVRDSGRPVEAGV